MLINIVLAKPSTKSDIVMDDEPYYEGQAELFGTQTKYMILKCQTLYMFKVVSFCFNALF